MHIILMVYQYLCSTQPNLPNLVEFLACVLINNKINPPRHFIPDTPTIMGVSFVLEKCVVKNIKTIDNFFNSTDYNLIHIAFWVFYQT